MRTTLLRVKPRNEWRKDSNAFLISNIFSQGLRGGGLFIFYKLRQMRCDRFYYFCFVLFVKYFTLTCCCWWCPMLAGLGGCDEGRFAGRGKGAQHTVPISSARWRPLLAPPKFSISIATNKSNNNKTQNQKQNPAPLSLPNTSDDGRKKTKQQRKLREVVLSTVSVVPPDNNSVGRLSTFNSDYAHTHTRTGERA